MVNKYLLFLGVLITLSSCKKEISSTEDLIDENLRVTSPGNDWSKVVSQSATFNLKTLINGNIVGENSNVLSQKLPDLQKTISSKNDTIATITFTNDNGSSLIKFENGEYFGVSSIPPEKIAISPITELLQKSEEYILIDSLWNGEPSFFLKSNKSKDSYVFDKNSSYLIAYLSETGYGKSTTTYGDYREKDGFILPFKKQIHIEEAGYLQEYTYETRNINPTFPSNHFEIEEEWKSLAKGSKIPGFTLPMILDDTRMVSSSEFEGKITLIDFWATWCKPCIEEFPLIEKQFSKYKDQGFQVVSISVDKTIERPRSYLKRKPFSWDLSLYSEGEFKSVVARDFQLVSLPKPILIDEEGAIIAMDAELRNGKLETVLEELFSEKNQ